MIKKLLFAFMLMLVSAITFAQNNGSVEMADTMRQNGKIYVVVAVILTIFTGIIIYLVRLDRKITKLEREYSNQ
jgi:uncharacterized integral membrane protein